MHKDTQCETFLIAYAESHTEETFYEALETVVSLSNFEPISDSTLLKVHKLLSQHVSE